jgi:hypothetical protein
MNESEGVVASTVGAFLRLEQDREGDKPTACGTALRGSESYGCSRKIAFRAAGVPKAHQFTDQTLLAFKIGNTLHELLQDAMTALWAEFKPEVVVDLRPLGFDMSGSADGVYSIGDDTLVLEIKTKSSFGFKLAKKADHPDEGELVQAAMYALGLGAQAVHLVYLAKEGAYRDGVKPGELLEWRYRLTDDFEGLGTVEELATNELWRQQQIADQVSDFVIPERDIPGHGVVDSPPPWQGKGQPWNCRYCDYRNHCAALPTEETPVSLSNPFIQSNWLKESE